MNDRAWKRAARRMLREFNAEYAMATGQWTDATDRMAASLNDDTAPDTDDATLALPITFTIANV